MVDDPEPDGPPSAIRTYIECLRRTPQDATWRLVVQDDAVPCTRFRERALAALSERPGHLVALFVPGMGLPGRWVREAAKRGERWCQLPTAVNWTPVVALCWPRALVEEFVPFAEEHVAARARRRMLTVGDDPVVGAFVRTRKLPVWATVPCLVEHPDVGWSLAKNRMYKGTNPARQAAVFVAD